MSRQNKVKIDMSWDRAIIDAKELIAQAEKKIEELNNSIQFFKKKKKAGEPFPLASKKAS